MKQIRALVVDDSQQMRRSILFALQRLPGITCACTEAVDGADALKKLSQGTFELVVTDINMPLMDGLKLISVIRQDAARKLLPIIVITTESAEEDRKRAMTLGASAYLVKPVQAKLVQDTVKRLLGLE
jgi:two-component system chemotaxis response regulator CheY